MKTMIFLMVLLLSPHSWSADCETRKGYTTSHTICWSKSLKAHVSKDCLTQKCDALKLKSRFPSQNVPGSNRTVDACRKTGADVIVLRDTQNNEESFCEFPDGSLRSSASVESAL